MILSYLEPSQILKFCEVVELKVQRVDANEGKNVGNVDEEPYEEHENVVCKDHVVDNTCKFHHVFTMNIVRCEK